MLSDRVCLRGILIRVVTGASWVDIEAVLDFAVSDTTLRARRATSGPRRACSRRSSAYCPVLIGKVRIQLNRDVVGPSGELKLDEVGGDLGEFGRVELGQAVVKVRPRTSTRNPGRRNALAGYAFVRWRGGGRRA